jgi:hypothetical protein
MATWQFATHLLPQSRLLELYGALRSTLDIDTLDSVEWWLDKQLPPDAESFLDSFLAKGTHWHEGTTLWGDIESDHLEISKAGGEVTGVYARIDVRERDDVFLNGLVEFAVKCDCIFWFPENERIVEPTLDYLLSEISESRAFHFVTNPLGFLKSLESLESCEKEGERES